ncbi:hypothetical protein [Microbacterium sorbitolivorans]|uniref:Uncharacterized protein n=1 Tax=Microbacterium sorbitolivorans TaxID=1867410 RepID=A0A367Y611_9MICO|nr:hypothetical protein [Microbacterium sorbitolivorans]RCK61304.1 hypothetical protein DTO57_01230 [Microbacterium sorbitolivorans]
MAVAVPAGLLLAIGVGALTLLTDVAEGEQALIVAAVFALVMSWGFIGLIWAMIVDRSTLRDAIDRPDESVESKWLDAAMSGALRDTVMLTGLTLAVVSIAGIALDGTWALIGVIWIAFFSTFVRYLMAKKRG